MFDHVFLPQPFELYRLQTAERAQGKDHQKGQAPSPQISIFSWKRQTCWVLYMHTV